MNKENLKRMRFIIPGIIIIIYIIPSLSDNAQELLNIHLLFQALKWSDSIYIVLIVLLSGLYYILNIRWLVWKPFNDKVTENIKNSLMRMCSLEISSEQWFTIKKDRTLMNVFYHLIGNDDSLASKSKDVMFNGLVWTTCFDFTILSATGGFVYLLLSIFSGNHHYIYISVTLYTLFYIGLAFSWLLTYRHINLSNGQLEVIKQRFKQNVDDQIKQALENL
ncbi:hypothetical protein [Desulfofustis glycolicus]|uniref:Uncharacterized protein n=1 Tax=Desulfofustis glycolicus DSM 9705 TaxID=1121409 RepID=A0A1M5YLT4_9BACT|nr:hypothetical protein [Desulfofustis glycolicus]SHI13047.1 hypothetical protein SAMN02745124_04208 [Desulfofustis glycolicus DSM 9705]